MKQKVCPKFNPAYEHELKRLAKYDKKNFLFFSDNNHRQSTRQRLQ